MKILGILLVVAAVAYPMAALAWLNRRMGRRPELSARQVGLILALDGVLPVCLIFFGLALMVPKMGESFAIRVVVAASAFATVALLIAIAATRQGGRAAPAAPKPRETSTDGG